MNLPLNQARRELVSCVIIVSAILSVWINVRFRPRVNVGPAVAAYNGYAIGPNKPASVLRRAEAACGRGDRIHIHESGIKLARRLRLLNRR